MLASRLVRFFLREEVFPRIPMARGLPGTISRLTHSQVLSAGLAVRAEEAVPRGDLRDFRSSVMFAGWTTRHGRLLGQ
jgi:hypothetical protein